MDILTRSTSDDTSSIIAAAKSRIPMMDGPNPMNRRVGSTDINGTRISTVFLALDHSHRRYSSVASEDKIIPYYASRGISREDIPGTPGYLHVKGPHDPILWETMIFEGPHNDYQKRCGGTVSNARAMHVQAVKLVLGSVHELHIESFQLLHQIVDLGFEPEPRKKFRKIMIDTYMAIPDEDVAEQQEMMRFLELNSRSIHEFIGRTNWDNGRYSNRGVVRKGDADPDTGLCPALISKSLLNDDIVTFADVEDLQADINKNWKLYVGDSETYNDIFVGLHVDKEFTNKPFQGISRFPETLFIRDMVNDRLYRLWGSSKCEDLLIFFGKRGYFISLPHEAKFSELESGYTSYSQITGFDDVEDTPQEMRSILQNAINPYAWRGTEEKVDDYGLAIFNTINEELDDPYIDPDSDNTRQPLHFVCGSEQGMLELFTMIMQASMPDQVWNAIGTNHIEVPVSASYEDEEAILGESYSGEHPGVDFIERNESVKNCIEEAITQNEPQGYYWEYNDGAHNRRSGYSANRETVTIIIYRPTAHERIVQMQKLESWCQKYGLPVPTNQKLVTTLNT